ncbi:MAG TPA: ATP-binding protein, partial [Verrucomicrobiae bacterium]|nr:ATP-binding protein [Verrucomicrobiae bacterium]
NGMKFVSPGVKPLVKISSETDGQYAVISVQDNGIGIAPESQSRIFRVFERLHSADDYPGTGLGLAIVRKGAERMGGTAGVESETGKGSRFWITLQLAPPGHIPAELSTAPATRNASFLVPAASSSKT